MNDLVLRCENIQKIFPQSTDDLHVLNDISLQLYSGEKVAIVGTSGSGKTTLLQILGGLDHPTSGTISLCNVDIGSIDDEKASFLRNKHLGFVYQLHHLLPELTAVDNVAMPLLIAGKSYMQAKLEAHKTLELVALGDRANHYPSQLSGGERQRTAIARAIVNKPTCVLADEPTGNLDENNALRVIELLEKICADRKMALILITHDANIANRMDKIYQISSGKLTLKS